jgi:putative oxidoreductase
MIVRIATRIRGLQELAATPEVLRKSVDVALLVVRIALAWIFIYNGGQKLFGIFGGSGLHDEAIFFASTAHLRPGMFFAVLSGITEFFGGIAVGVGVLGRLAAVGLFADMVIATVTVTFKNGFISNAAGSGYELNVALAALAAGVVLVGTGRLGVDFALRRLLLTARPKQPIVSNLVSPNSAMQ